MSGPKIVVDNASPACYIGGVVNGDQMRAVREANGMTQAEVAEKLGISRNYLTMMETGERRISQRTAIAFCAVVNAEKSKGQRRSKTA